MNKPIIKIHNIETDEIIERELDDIELAQYEKDLEIESINRAEKKAKIEARQALLERLGLTEDEAKLLLS